MTPTHRSSKSFCIATGKGTSVNVLYRGLADIIGHDVEIIRAPKRPGDVYLSCFDCRRAEKQLGWKAEVGLEEGLRLTADYFKSIGSG